MESSAAAAFPTPTAAEIDDHWAVRAINIVDRSLKHRQQLPHFEAPVMFVVLSTSVSRDRACIGPEPLSSDDDVSSRNSLLESGSTHRSIEILLRTSRRNTHMNVQQPTEKIGKTSTISQAIVFWCSFSPFQASTLGGAMIAFSPAAAVALYCQRPPRLFSAA